MPARRHGRQVTDMPSVANRMHTADLQDGATPVEEIHFADNEEQIYIDDDPDDAPRQHQQSHSPEITVCQEAGNKISETSMVSLLESHLINAQRALAEQHQLALGSIKMLVSSSQEASPSQIHLPTLKMQGSVQKSNPIRRSLSEDYFVTQNSVPPEREHSVPLVQKPSGDAPGLGTETPKMVSFDQTESADHKRSRFSQPNKFMATINWEDGNSPCIFQAGARTSQVGSVENVDGMTPEDILHGEVEKSAKVARVTRKRDKRLSTMPGSSKDTLNVKKEGPKSVFVDADAMKARVREALMKPEYNVQNFYKKQGAWQWVAKSTLFDNATLTIIFLNSLWIAIDTDYNHSKTLLDADAGFQVGENIFCVYFFTELLTRFMAFETKRNCLKDGWFVFDSALVFMMVVETWIVNLVVFLMGGGGGEGGLGNASILRLVRLLRLTRMARMVRLLRAMPELMILVKGIVVAARSVMFTLCLLFIVIYVFGIAFTQLADGTPLADSYFTNVPTSMGTLLLRGALPDSADFVTEIGAESIFFAIFALVFILISCLTVLNMLVGVLCEVVSVVSSVEKEQLTVQFVRTKLFSLLEENGIDEDGNKLLSRSEFETLLLMPEGARIIQEVGVDVVGLVDFADHIFQDGAELSFPDFMELVLQLRGTNTATVRDIVEMRKFVTTSLHSTLQKTVRKIHEMMLALQTGQENMAHTPRHDESLSRVSALQLDGGQMGSTDSLNGAPSIMMTRNTAFVQPRQPRKASFRETADTQVLDFDESPSAPKVQISAYNDKNTPGNSRVRSTSAPHRASVQVSAKHDQVHPEHSRNRTPSPARKSNRPISAQARVAVPPNRPVSATALPAFPQTWLADKQASFKDGS